MIAEARWLRDLLDRTIELTEFSVTALLCLGRECIQGAALEDVCLWQVPFKDVLNILFSAAANGGAYNSGHYAAYGRLEAWRSAAGLVGSSEGMSFQELAAQADRRVWFLFDATSDWFYQVAWDLGVLVLRPDGMTAAVLAATDTD